MTSRKAMVRKLDVGANGVGIALAELQRLVEALHDGKPLSALLAHCEELGEAIVRIEDAVGVQTPLALFQ